MNTERTTGILRINKFSFFKLVEKIFKRRKMKIYDVRLHPRFIEFDYDVEDWGQLSLDLSKLLDGRKK